MTVTMTELRAPAWTETPAPAWAPAPVVIEWQDAAEPPGQEVEPAGRRDAGQAPGSPTQTVFAADAGDGGGLFSPRYGPQAASPEPDGGRRPPGGVAGRPARRLSWRRLLGRPYVSLRHSTEVHLTVRPKEEIAAGPCVKPMLPDPLDTFVKRAILERPSCRKCRHPMRVGRNLPGVARYSELSFECSTCGCCETLAIPVRPLRTDTIGWLASELRPPK